MVDQVIQRRRLLRHGFVFLFLALLLGIAITALPHPGRWLAAHLSALLTGLLLIATGVIWSELRLSPRQRAIAAGCALTSAYAGIAANIFGAIVDFPGPASAPGVVPPMPQAAVFFTLLAIVVPTILIAIGLGVYGMRGRLPE